MWSVQAGDLYLRRHKEFEARRDEQTHVLHLLSIGFKATQPSDLKACRRLVDSIRKGKING